MLAGDAAHLFPSPGVALNAGLIDSVKTVIAACVDAMPTHAQFIAKHCAVAA